MYQKRTREDWLIKLNLPGDYKLEGLLIAGSNIRGKQKNALSRAIQKLNLNVKYSKLEFPFFDTIDILEINGKNYWFELAYGGAYLSEVVHVASLLGSKKNILVGSCGGLQYGGKSADIVLPEYSFGNESTTRMYSRNSTDNRHYSNSNLIQEISNKIDVKFKVHKGPIITCQAMQAETWEDIENWSNEGYLGVEMESATFFAVSNYFKVPSAAILYITDNLIEQEMHGSETHQATKQFREEVRDHNYEVSLSLLLGQ